MKGIRFVFKPSGDHEPQSDVKRQCYPSGASAEKVKKKVQLPVKIWFWIHKILFVSYNIALYRNINELMEESWFGYTFYYGKLRHTKVYGNTLLPESKDFLERILLNGSLQYTLFALMLICSVFSLIAFKRTVTDIDRKRNYFKDPRVLLDIILNIIAAVMAVNSAGAANYSFLSTGPEDSVLLSKYSLFRRIEKDLDETDNEIPYTLPVSDVSLEKTDFGFRIADVSPLAWGFHIPGGEEFTIWYQRNDNLKLNYEPGLYTKYGNPLMHKLEVYTLNADNMSFPLSADNYYLFIGGLIKSENDDTAVTELYYYPEFGLLKGFCFKGKNGDIEPEYPNWDAICEWNRTHKK